MSQVLSSKMPVRSNRRALRALFGGVALLATCGCSAGGSPQVSAGGASGVGGAEGSGGAGNAGAGGAGGAQEPLPFGSGALWAFDEAKGTTVTGATLSGAPAWVAGKINTALHFNGTKDGVHAAAPVVDPTKSVSIAAWVQLDRVDAAATILGLNGQVKSALTLGFAPTSPAGPGGFVMTFADADSASAGTTRVVSSFAPVAGVFYHVVGVRDAATGKARLYVNGARVGEVAASKTFSGARPTSVGHGISGGAPTGFLAGTLDEIEVAAAAWSDDEVTTRAQAASAITPIRPPSVPLIVRSPYVSSWMPADQAPGHWPTFWTGAIKALTGLVRVDGKPFVFFGAPTGIPDAATQVQLEITSTQSRYVFAAGGVNLYVDFVSPVEATDMKRLSEPFGYIHVQAVAVDGKSHDTSVYMDISGEWAHGDTAAQINWSRSDVASADGMVSAFAVTPNKPGVLGEFADYATWGSAIWATGSSGIAYQAGADKAVRAQFAGGSKLGNTIDANQPRAISDSWPVFAYEADLGSLSGVASPERVFVLGHVRTPAASYRGAPVPGLWQAYWPTWEKMLADSYSDVVSGGTLKRAGELDLKIGQAAVAAGGAHYAGLCALALRQAFGGVELINTSADPWLLLKEISSDGNVATVDVTYPGMPAFLYVNPKLLRYMIQPVLAYAESGHWNQPFAEHDLGSSYPNASAHDDGGGENMPVEESADMLIMVAAYLRAAADDDSKAFGNAHYAILKKWGDYLVDNALDPANQNQTDDFTGFIGHSSNLALKGILGIGAMGQMAATLGKTADADHYTSISKSYISQWAQKSEDASKSHLKLAYDQPDTTWSLKYNSYPDKLLGLGLIPQEIMDIESKWYTQQKAQFGFPLDVRHAYTKADWEMWTAAGVSDLALRQAFVDTLFTFASETPSRVPFTDWYDTQKGTQSGFQARPVVGGLFSLLTLTP